jgi:6-pyruvoyltetrahydropterin/6-carboxytetrahydropterin synthase
MTNKLIYITHSLTFCAAHKLYNPAWSDEKNAELFAPCHNDHGHNYTLMVTLRGPVNTDTGMLMNFKTLAHLMRIHVHDKLDHKHLNHDIPEFKKNIPTAENVAIVIWKWLSEVIPSGLLYEVRLHETEKNRVIYRGEDA